jgi:hypothetical protein
MRIAKERIVNDVNWTSNRFSHGPSIDRVLAECLNIASDAQRARRDHEADEIVRGILADFPLAEIPVEVLCPLTVRILNAMWNTGIWTLDSLIACKLSDLRRWKNFGKVSIALVGTRMRAVGLNLSAQSDYAWVRPLPTRLHERPLLIPMYRPTTPA